MQPSRGPIRILFVCMGNICRSPAAEIIFRQMVEDAGRAEDFHIDSAGTIGHHEGSPPGSRMAEALRRHGFPVTGRARRIRVEDLERFDWIITMDESNFADVRSLDPTGTYHQKIRQLVTYCRNHEAPRVPDPYYGGQRGFEHVIDLLKDGCAGILRENNP